MKKEQKKKKNQSHLPHSFCHWDYLRLLVKPVILLARDLFGDEGRNYRQIGLPPRHQLATGSIRQPNRFRVRVRWCAVVWSEAHTSPIVDISTSGRVGDGNNTHRRRGRQKPLHNGRGQGNVCGKEKRRCPTL